MRSGKCPDVMRALGPAFLALLVGGCISPGIVGQAGDGGIDGGMDAGRDSGRIDAPFDAGSCDGGSCVTPVACGDRQQLLQCGNGMDDDRDGLIDSRDLDCLGPCDNNESGYFLDTFPASATGCSLDCYFDSDQGPGNDGCEWDHQCDRREPSLECPFVNPPPPSVRCPSIQSDTCGALCSPLVPNGCDCFGCCELPARSGRYVFIGSLNAAGEPTCSSATLGNDADCHPCTPVGDCLNPCGTCELCLGSSELPPECADPDGGTPDCGGRMPCGLPNLPPCEPDSYCITGCCTYFG